MYCTSSGKCCISKQAWTPYQCVILNLSVILMFAGTYQ